MARKAAAPVIVLFKSEYYLFPSVTNRNSKDLRLVFITCTDAARFPCLKAKKREISYLT